MTTVDAAAAGRTKKRIALAALTAFLGMSLGGCETTNNVLGQGGDSASAPLAQQSAPQSPRARVAVAPVIGAPEDVAKQLTTQLTGALGAQRVTVVSSPPDAFDYTLRGYIVAAKEKSGTKISYIWDVTDPSGKRVNRITGEEVAAGATSRDPWAAVTPAVVQTIANRTAASLVAALPAGGPKPAASTPMASGASGAASGGAPVTTAAVRSEAVSGPTTASIPQADSVSAIVPNVAGAPGDGSQALASALQRELSRSGVALAAANAPTAYRVEGSVKMGPGKDGKQPIQIDWLVKDPKGNRLGTVSQKNEIPQGSLDGAWGKTADAAAAAAAQGILKLLPAPTRTN